MPQSPITGQIMLFAGNFAPRNYALCNGQILPISQNTALFSILGTFYGGNGTSNFGLPNFQGLTAISSGQGLGLSDRVVGETGGEQTVTLLSTEMPQHTHLATATTGAADKPSPAGNIWAVSGSRRATTNLYSTSLTAANMPALAAAGSNLPHNNMQPYLAISFCIALVGIFPARN